MKRTRNSRRLIVSLRRLRKSTPPAPQRDGDNWQKFIEAEMAAFNRRLARIETLTLILIILVVATDMEKAADLLQRMLKL